MFSCFGFNRKPKKNVKTCQEEDKDPKINLVSLQNEISNLTIDAESYKLQSSILEDLLSQYKKVLANINSVSDENLQGQIEQLVMKENYILKQSCESLTGSVEMLEANFNELYLQLEQLSDPTFSEKEKAENNKFCIEYLLMQKQNIIISLENKLKQLQQQKKNNTLNLIDEIYVDNFNNHNTYNPYDLDNLGELKDRFELQPDPNRETIKKIIQDNLEMSRGMYQKLSKQIITETTNHEETKKKIQEIKKEIEEIRNPSQVQLNSNNINTMTTDTKSTKKHCMEGAKNENENENKEKEKEEVIGKIEELNKNKEIITELLAEIETTKKANDTLENEIGTMSNDLVNKFSIILQLEKELEMVKTKRKALLTNKLNK